MIELMQQVDRRQLWESSLVELRTEVSEATLNSWVRPCFIDRVEEIDEKRLLIELACPSGFHQKTVDERYFSKIRKVLEEQTQKQVELALVVKQELVLAKQKSGRAVTGEPAEYDLFTGEEKLQKEVEIKSLESGLNPRFSFENFVVGGSNNLAYAAAKGVVDDPGRKHNPLFLWGGVGVGKTHLMHAVGKELLGRGLAARGITSEQFTNELVATIRNKRVDEFKKKYRNVEALLIDDVQFFAGKESTQEEFFHTFNELYMKGKQIILTSDRRPQEIERVEQRLISRFLGGLTVDIGLPDFEMRLAILKQKAMEIRAEVEEAALSLMAERVNTNSRELEGVLMRLVNVAAVKGGRLTQAMVERELGGGGGREERDKKKMRPQELISAVAKEFEFRNKDIVGKSRKAELVLARHIAMFLLREEMGLTLQSVAELMGGRDHTTVMHAVEKIEQEFELDQRVREQVMKIKQKIYG